MASNDLKKVGLVFNADGSTDFIKSMQIVNTTLKENYQDFQLVQAQWDKSTTASQKLADKLNYLNEAYDIQKDKVNILKRELDELESSENRDETAIQRKKIALTQAETSLQKYSNQIEDTTKKIKSGTAGLEDFAKKLEKVEDVLTNAGKKLSIFSAAYVAGLGASAKSAIEFESAFAGVEKTVDATDEELADLRQGIRDLSKVIPATTTEISGVAEAAGQLGIKKESILSFTKTMIDLGESTNLSSSEAADSLARLANITGMAQSDFDRLGATIVHLGNNGASTEKDITEMALRLAGAGKTVGLTEANIVSFANALSSVGIEAEMGGSAFSKMMIEIESAVATGSGSLKQYAEISGMTVKEFKKLWEKDAAGAMVKFMEGLGNVEKNGGNLITTLEDLDIKEVRLRDTMLRAANASGLFKESVEMGNKAWEENTALLTEAEKRYATTESQMKIAKNTLNDIAITIGEKLLPHINNFLTKIEDMLNWFSNLSPEIQNLILLVGGLIAALGPLLLIVGAVLGFISKLAMAATALQIGLLPLVGIIAGIIIGITALIAIIALVIMNFDKIKEFAGLIWEKVKEVFEAIKVTIFETMTSVSETVVNVFNTVVDFIKSVIDNVILILTGPFELLKNIFILIVALIAMLLESIWNLIKPFVDQVILIIQSIWDGISSGINFVKNILTGILNFIWSNILQPIMNFFSSIFSNIWNIISGVIEKIKQGFSYVKDFVINIFSAIKDTISNIFSSIAGIIKTPINGVIGLINNVLKSLNKIKVPDWVPGMGGAGVNFSMIPMLAKGGQLLEGMAVVAEAGPELLMQQGNKTSVMPLSDGGGATPTKIIDYEKLALAFMKALNSCKLELDDDGFARLIDKRLWEVT